MKINIAKSMNRIFKAVKSPFSKTIKSDYIPPEPVKIPEPKRTRNRVIPQHNNRKRTPGRMLQYAPMGNGKFRVIYH